MNVGSHRRWAPEGRRRRVRRLPAIGRFLAGVASGVLAGVAAHANPVGPTVVHGTAQFARPDTSTLNVTNSANAIINWQGFSIDSAEVTRFIQPSATSAVLNRVTGSDPSTILGQLLSNGRVFLVNPHGIVFGEGAVVDTAGLVASTLGIGDADFLAGRYRFDAGPDAGDITNRGSIEAGADGVFLLAPNIENSGVIRTDGGDLVLAAGRTVTLTSLDLDGVQVEVQAPEDEVLNLGDLIAERGAVGAFAGSIRNSGTVEANAVTVDDDGTIRLVAQGDITLEEGSRVAAEGPSGGEVHIESETGTTWVSGEVSARGSEGRGGTIRLLGHQVGLDGAQVDASGPDGGGEVLVGGDESGEGSVPTADSTYVSSDSTVSADALDDGDGGKVVVFAEGFANILGRLSARGGPNGGDGGFVETSGLESFVILHTPDTTGPSGEGGHWLIDPNNIEIVPGTGADNITGTNPFTSTDDSARIGIDLIIAALSGGQTVTVQTTEGGGNGEIGHIVLNAALDVERTSGTNTLILDAHGGIGIRPTDHRRGGRSGAPSGVGRRWRHRGDQRRRDAARRVSPYHGSGQPCARLQRGDGHAGWRHLVHEQQPSPDRRRWPRKRTRPCRAAERRDAGRNRVGNQFGDLRRRIRRTRDSHRPGRERGSRVQVDTGRARYRGHRHAERRERRQRDGQVDRHRERGRLRHRDGHRPGLDAPGGGRRERNRRRGEGRHRHAERRERRQRDGEVDQHRRRSGFRDRDRHRHGNRDRPGLHDYHGGDRQRHQRR